MGILQAERSAQDAVRFAPEIAGRVRATPVEFHAALLAFPYAEEPLPDAAPTRDSVAAVLQAKKEYWEAAFEALSRTPGGLQLAPKDEARRVRDRTVIRLILDDISADIRYVAGVAEGGPWSHAAAGQLLARKAALFGRLPAKAAKAESAAERRAEFGIGLFVQPHGADFD